MPLFLLISSSLGDVLMKQTLFLCHTHWFLCNFWHQRTVDGIPHINIVDEQCRLVCFRTLSALFTSCCSLRWRLFRSYRSNTHPLVRLVFFRLMETDLLSRRNQTYFFHFIADIYTLKSYTISSLTNCCYFQWKSYCTSRSPLPSCSMVQGLHDDHFWLVSMSVRNILR